ncbi:SDR family NAD(P)-dependent oxidoreductase [Novosphingobium album (ex Hu et al. 2023)]|uniref:SDR family oxidoreductase n=1 Tax=Novosphingobium album (ex Hu et al. 2023) TaxID=2930093 RepID=A0ABT0B5A4_9SPHN|nr:SDR family oxidoreductase [Novosphingobium album (ex Hu et al. 2023)]MCJ2180246.1 SDR family oxidoreductase [Novosphingobium album (ex Hu et al. 2023)]
MEKFLEGKTALVTGASRGLGRATAEDLAACGALVAINYASNDKAAQDTLQAIESAGGKAFLIKSPQGSFEAAEEMAAALDEELTKRTGSNGLDILVNNAGGGPVHSLDTTTPEIFNQVLSTNFSGAFFATKVLKPRLRDGGRVIFVSSLGARNALPDYVIYACAKSAIETLTKVVAKELGPRNITVNCITPGMIESDANADLRENEQLKQHLMSITPLGRIGVPSEFSGVVRSLVSPQMNYVTGQNIEISGGMSL